VLAAYALACGRQASKRAEAALDEPFRPLFLLGLLWAQLMLGIVGMGLQALACHHLLGWLGPATYPWLSELMFCDEPTLE
jgi:uncharacterized protein involved in response to NO